MRALLLLALLANFPSRNHDMPPPVAHRYAPSSGSSAPAWAFCDQLQAGDKAGAWACMNGDASSPAGSALAFSAHGSPPATAGTTCASPSFFTLTNASNQYLDATTTFTSVTTAFSICVLLTNTDLTVSTATPLYLGNGSTNSVINISTGGGSPTDSSFYTSGTVTNPAGFTVYTNVRTLLCTTYDGAGNGALYFQKAGQGSSSQFTAGSVSPSAVTGSILGFGGCPACGGIDWSGAILGGVYTAKQWSKADVERIASHVVDCL